MQIQPLPTIFRGQELSPHVRVVVEQYEIVQLWSCCLVGNFKLSLFAMSMFVCVYFLDVFSWCFLLRIAGRSVNAEILELWTSDSENLWNSLGIMEFSILKYRVSILVCNTRVSYKNHLWTNLLRSPWWKETHVLKRLKNGWWLTPFTRVSCHADASQSCRSWRWSCLGTSWPEAWTSSPSGSHLVKMPSVLTGFFSKSRGLRYLL